MLKFLKENGFSADLIFDTKEIWTNNEDPDNSKFYDLSINHPLKHEYDTTIFADGKEIVSHWKHENLNDRKMWAQAFFSNKYENFCDGNKENFWDDNKVIDFVNWFLKLHKLPWRYTLENQNIIDSFKQGDKPEEWHRNFDDGN